MKDLPKVFANKIEKNIDNDQEIFYGSNRSVNTNQDSRSISKKINDIFKDSSHVYKSRVKITLKNGIVNKDIVGKTNTSLITMNGELIKIIDILDIEKI